MIAFINDHREAYGIEPICKVSPRTSVAPPESVPLLLALAALD